MLPNITIRALQRGSTLTVTAKVNDPRLKFSQLSKKLRREKLGNRGTAPLILNLCARLCHWSASLLMEQSPVPTVRDGGLKYRPEGSGGDKNFLCQLQSNSDSPADTTVRSAAGKQTHCTVPLMCF